MRFFALLGLVIVTATAYYQHTCDGQQCLQDADDAGFPCASEALAQGRDLVDDVACASHIYTKYCKLMEPGAPCEFCMDQMQRDILQYLHNHPSPRTAYPSATGVYQGAYETQYGGESGVFYYDGYGDDGYGSGSAAPGSC